MPGSRPVTGQEKKAGATGDRGPRRAMLLAAGRGLRLRPITKKLPKALVKVGGRTLLDWALDRLKDAGVEDVVINHHHLGHMIERHLSRRQSPTIVFSPEDEAPLETGGGVARALPLLGEEPFFVINADALWLDSLEPALLRMARAWDETAMDALLMLHATVDAYGYQGRGDFCIDPLGRVERRPEFEISPYLFTGVQILHPKLFVGAPEGAFSLNLIYDRAIEAERLHGIVHDGEWFHVGTPDGLAEANAYMRVRYPGIKRR